MRSTAAECARLLATQTQGDAAVEAFALRRLEAVPEVPVFHVGGPSDWSMTLESDARRVRVAIEGHARPLPLLGVVAAAFGRCDGLGVVLHVEVDEDMRPQWFGGGYDEWVSVW